MRLRLEILAPIPDTNTNWRKVVDEDITVIKGDVPVAEIWQMRAELVNKIDRMIDQLLAEVP